MESVTYYLKYRPQKISEIDVTQVREGLEKILSSGRIPHAFLFSGPKGIGKTSTARLVAKSVNCRNKKGAEPCNQCAICQEITNGSALDLLEIDAASNRGIDDIRNLREKIKLMPAKCQYKVYIIDEAHMLTTEAFNALLKTLEEPPAHAIFILCTTAPEKLPKTIISRCLQFKFSKATALEMKRSLQRVIKAEKLDLEKGVLEEIDKAVDGSFRDAHKILEQLSFAGKKITLQETKKLLGQIEELSPQKLLNFLVFKEAKTALLEIDRVVKTGGDLNIYSQGLLEELRIILLAKMGVGGASGIEIEKWQVRELQKLIQLFSQAALEIKTSPIPQLPLELAVVEWCEGEILGSPSEILVSASDSLAKKHTLLNETHSRSQVEASQNLPGSPRTSSRSRHPSDSAASLAAPSPQNLPSSPPSVNGNGLDSILEKWPDLLAGVKPLNHSVEALLRAARPVKMEGEFLTLEVFYKFHKERLETEKCRAIVEEVASQVLGSPIKLKCVLGKKEDILDVANAIFSGKAVD